LLFPGFFRKPGKQKQNPVNPVNPVETFSGLQNFHWRAFKEPLMRIHQELRNAAGLLSLPGFYLFFLCGLRVLSAAGGESPSIICFLPFALCRRQIAVSQFHQETEKATTKSGQSCESCLNILGHGKKAFPYRNY
jgi:hypothetical protein